jgi:uncharacterized protein with HEPN domain
MSRRGTRLFDYLLHILQAIDRIKAYVANVQESQFLVDSLLQDAVIRNLEIVGEASRNILRDHPEFSEENESLPLKSAYEMRNVLAHGYFEVDIDIVWRTIVDDLPVLALQVRHHLEKSSGNG